MSFANKIQEHIEYTRTTIAGLTSLSEYLHSRCNKLRDLLNSRTSGDVMSFKHYIPELDSYAICQVSTEDLYDACNGIVDSVHAVYSSAGDYIEITEDEITDVFEEHVEDLQLQAEFIDVSLTDAATEADTWINNMINKHPNFTVDKLETFAQYLRCGDKWTALQSWLRTLNSTTATKESTYVSLIQRDSFAGTDGDVWVALIDRVNQKLDEYFDKVWDNLMDIQGTFNKLWNAILKVTRWVLSKAFKGLTTNFEKGDARIGVMDVPLMTICLKRATFNSETGQVSDSNDLYVSTAVSDVNNLFTYNKLVLWGFIDNQATPNYVGINNGGSTNCWKDAYFNNLRQIFYDCYEYDSESKTFFYKVLDSVYSGPDWSTNRNLLFRYGFVDDGQGTPGSLGFYLQVFFLCPSSHYDNYTDYEIFNQARESFSFFCDRMATDFGFPIYTNSGGQYPGAMTYFDQWYRSGKIFDLTDYPQSEPGSPINITNYIRYINYSDQQSALTEYVYEDPDVSMYSLSQLGCVMLLIANLIIPYTIIHSDIRPVYWDSYGVMRQTYGSFSPAASLFKYGYGVNVSVDRDTYPGFDTSYVPYNKEQPIGVSLHFQDLEDRTNELGKFILVCIIAAAAAAVTVAIHKFRKTQKAKIALARGAADNYAWQNGTTMTPEKIEEWKRLDKIARKQERIGKIFGLVSNVATSQASSKLMSDMALANARQSTAITGNSNINLKNIDDDILNVRRIIVGE